jgi:hypothetical protein
MLIWVQFLFKPNSPNIFFTRVSISELGSSLICQRTASSGSFKKFQNPRTGCFRVFENHQNQIMARSWYFKTFKEPPISMKEVPILSWFFDCLKFSFGLTPAGGGFTKWELLVICLSIYLVWRPAKSRQPLVHSTIYHLHKWLIHTIKQSKAKSSWMLQGQVQEGRRERRVGRCT